MGILYVEYRLRYNHINRYGAMVQDSADELKMFLSLID